MGALYIRTIEGFEKALLLGGLFAKEVTLAVGECCATRFGIVLTTKARVQHVILYTYCGNVG